VQDVAEGAVGGDGERAVGGHGLDPLGRHHHRPELVVELPQAGEDLQRPDQIQQREPWVEHERDRLLLLGCHRLPFRSGVGYCAASVMGGGALVRSTAVG
jgi:hypothetical protein